MTALSFLAAVAAGGMLGGMIRYLASRTLPFLWATFAANMAACLLVGYVQAAAGQGLSDLLVAFAGTGVAGATSTWSTLAKELGGLAKAKRFATLLVYLASSLLVGTAAVAAGAQLA